jgi:NAD(P)-dependent dehydrogenase (short-subunit alcohol dehydrogenase family)
MASFTGKVIAITGGASGIGLSTAKLLAARGAAVSIADVQQKALDEAKAAILAETKDAKVLVFALDVQKNDTVVAWIAKTVETFGGLDGIANIAGVFKAIPDHSIEKEEDDHWNFLLGVNLTGVMNCMRAAVPHMKSGGSIVNASSILGLEGAAGRAAYCASKHGVIGLTRATAKDVGKRGIRVNCFAP